MSGIEWLTTAEVAAITKRAESEIRRALRSRELVGEQRSPRSHYRIDRRAVDACTRGRSNLRRSAPRALAPGGQRVYMACK